jgi:hypothetical protein
MNAISRSKLMALPKQMITTASLVSGFSANEGTMMDATTKTHSTKISSRTDIDWRLLRIMYLFFIPTIT